MWKKHEFSTACDSIRRPFGKGGGKHGQLSTGNPQFFPRDKFLYTKKKMILILSFHIPTITTI